MTLGDARNGQRVRLIEGGEVVTVIRQDRDDFDRWTLCLATSRPRRSKDDAREYQFATGIACEALS